MGLMLKQQRNGILRPQWYGVYTVAGARKVLNLDVPVQGTPPENLSLRKTGDRDFERSREKAEEALACYVAEASHKGLDKTGKPPWCRPLRRRGFSCGARILPAFKANV